MINEKFLNFLNFKEESILKRKVTWRNIVGYGAADLFGNGAMSVASTWILFFYTAFGGLSPVLAGTILAIARVADSFISPLMGYMTDHFGATKLGRKFGRRRFFLLIAIPLMFLYIIIWVAHMGFWYYLATYLLMEAFTALVMIPYETLAAEMTDSYDMKSKLSSSRMLWSALATFLASWLPGRVFAVMGKNNPNAFLTVGIILAVVFCLAIGLTYFSTFERETSGSPEEIASIVNESAAKTGNPLLALWNMIKDMGSVFRIKSYALHLAIYLCSFTARDIIGATYVFYIVYAMKSNPTEASNILTFGSIIGIPCNLVWPKIMSKLGPSKLLRIMYLMMFFTVACYAALFYGQAAGTSWGIMALYALQVTWGVSNSGTGYVPWTVYTFIPDVDEIVTKQRREGVFAGIMTFARKTTSALAPFLTGIVLSAFGFSETAKTQSATAMNGLIIWMVLGSGVMLLAAHVITYFFHLDRQHHGILRAEIDRLKAGGKMSDVDPETKKVVESLTGFKYEQLWGHNNIV
ncbi:Na galactoside symporter family permease [Lentilactobacillus sunkii DSM 19904]|uniref:Na galactoside symporter family permease n=1 Tax=Lentilactobacillus sunkii DSM 19904 TaxID=1423808 RepID=A0A0R1L895_9LACO|nr:Na galactoside symporter family permease [Lentilactobacillus sunkii DSM 19904]